jgi:hypothetical protein
MHRRAARTELDGIARASYAQRPALNIDAPASRYGRRADQ